MRGVTLVELIVTLAVLGLALSLTAVGVASLGPGAPAEETEAIARTRSEAIQSGRAMQLVRDSDQVVLFLPDGRVLGPGMDAFTGGRRDST